LDSKVTDIGNGKKSYPPLDDLITDIDQQIEGRPHPYAKDGFEAFLGSQLGSFKRRGRQYLCFYLHDTQFAFPMEHTLEITYRTDVTPLPNLPQWVLGISNVRGNIISVVDLARVLGLAHRDAAPGKHLILIRDADVTTGIIADKIAGTIFDEDPNHRIEKQAPKDETPARFISGVFVDDRQKIYLLAVHELMAALALR
jgi:purine-binding chemotaxis protein CheW